MKIKVLSLVKEKGLTLDTCFDESTQFKLFKPDNLHVNIIISDHARIEIEVYNGAMTLEEFLTEIGYVASNEEITKSRDKLEKLHSFIQSKPEIEYAPKRKFADNSNSAMLAREVLKEDSRCTKEEFRSIAFDLYKTLGFSKADFEEACKHYA